MKPTNALTAENLPAPTAPLPPLDDPRVEAVVEQYMALMEAGARSDREAFVKAHPELAPVLGECLAALDFLNGAAPQLGRPEESPAPAEGPGLHAATALGDFRIVREVGRGGMGVVYEAVQLSLGRRVALKVLPFAATLDAKQLQRFKNEAQAAALLQHQSIVPVYGVGCERGVHYYAMQFIEGQTVAALIAELRPPAKPDPERAAVVTPEARPAAASAETATRAAATVSTERSTRSTSFFRTVAGLGVQAAEALEHAHEQGVVHRDVKPANLLVDARGKLWVTDFGLAHCQSQAGLTMTGDLVGTLRYMSPEQALAQRAVIDHRTDIYSLGATLYEFLTQAPVFDGSGRQELLRQIAFEDPRRPRRLNKSIPAELETIVLKALEKNPADRYATAQEFGDDLRRFLEDKPIRACRPTLVEQTRRWSRRHKYLLRSALAVLVVAVLALAIGTWLIWQKEQEIRGAYDAELQKRQQATANFERALEAMDQVYKRFAESALEKPQFDAADRQQLEEVLAFYEQYAQTTALEAAAWRETARAYGRVGTIRGMLGQYDKAKEAFVHVIALAPSPEGEHPAEPEFRRHLAQGHFERGRVLAENHRFPEAEGHFRLAMTLDELLAAEFPNKPSHRENQACDLNMLGMLLKDTGRASEAELAYQQAVSLIGKLREERPDEPKYRGQLANVLSNQATIRLDQHEWAEACQLLDGAIRHQQAFLQARPGEHTYRNSLAKHYRLLAVVQINLHQFLEAEQAMELGLGERQRLVKENPEVAAYKFELAACRYNYGILLNGERRFKDAEASYRKTLNDLDELTRKFPDQPDYQSLWGATLNNLAILLARRGEWAEAVRLTEQAVEHQQTALKSNPRHKVYQDNLCNHYVSLAFYLANFPDACSRNPAGAIEMANKALKLDQQKRQAHLNLGEAHYRAGDWSAAVNALETSLKLKNGDDPEAEFFLAMSHWRLGDEKTARKLYGQAVGAMKTSQPEDYRELRFRAEAAELLGVKDEPKPKEPE